jgi:hypothetical protein
MEPSAGRTPYASTSYSSPPSERRPFIPDTNASPTSPSFGPISHSQNHHEVNIEPISPRPYNHLKPASFSPARQPLYQEPYDPTEYTRDISDDESPEGYHLVGRDQEPRSFHRMDMEIERLREKDQRMKRNIRRFRFVVRSAHLACR